jgi:Flp pilus assembly protein TadB
MRETLVTQSERVGRRSALYKYRGRNSLPPRLLSLHTVVGLVVVVVVLVVVVVVVEVVVVVLLVVVEVVVCRQMETRRAIW